MEQQPLAQPPPSRTPLDLLRQTAAHQPTWGTITATTRMATTSWQITGHLARRKSNTNIKTPRQNDHALVQDLPLGRSETRATEVAPTDHRRHGLLPTVLELEEAPITPTTTILPTITPPMPQTDTRGILQTTTIVPLVHRTTTHKRLLQHIILRPTSPIAIIIRS